MMFSSRAVKLTCVAVSALALASCSGHHSKKTATTSSSPAPSTTAATTTAPPVPKAINPFTGGAPSTNDVVAVKIEDIAAGRPQVGIDKANVVYIEQVEGGLTRLLAIFNSVLPSVEPVRSTRPSDPELVAQYGPIDYVASGGAHSAIKRLDASPLHTSINDRGGPGFSRDGNRAAPHNLRSNLATVSAKLKGPQAKSIGFTFSPTIVNTVTAPGTVVSTTVGGTAVNFRYSPVTHEYVRYIDGVRQKTAAGVIIQTPNVIVQFCKSNPDYTDKDVLGNPAQYTHTVGSGKVVIFRDGKRIVGTWSRPTLASGTTYKDASGAVIALKPGGEWVVLTANGRKLA